MIWANSGNYIKKKQLKYTSFEKVTGIHELLTKRKFLINANDNLKEVWGWGVERTES